MPRHIAGEHSDLAIGDLARRASVLACDPPRGLALFQKAGLIDDENHVLITKRFQRILTYNIAQRVGIPLPPAQARHGPGSPAAFARIRPVLRGSLPNSPSRNCPAADSTRSCVNSGRMRCLASRNDEAHSVSVPSTDAPPIIRSRIMVAHGFRALKKLQL